MNIKRSGIALSAFLVFAVFPTWAQNPHCEQVGGVLMTNIGAIKVPSPQGTNLGPVFGDLAGSVAATILGQNPDGTFNIQHYWVTASGETIKFDVAHLTPTATDDPNVVAVKWGNYKSDILGGTGKFADATGTLEYFGLADFHQLTLVLRYRGEVCFSSSTNASKK